jgi:hypothetical protein
LKILKLNDTMINKENKFKTRIFMTLWIPPIPISMRALTEEHGIPPRLGSERVVQTGYVDPLLPAYTSRLDGQRGQVRVIPIPKPTTSFHTYLAGAAATVLSGAAVYKFVPDILKTSVCQISVTAPGFLGGKTIETFCQPTALGRFLTGVSEHATLLVGATVLAAATLCAIKKFKGVNPLPKDISPSTTAFPTQPSSPRKNILLLTDAPHASSVERPLEDVEEVSRDEFEEVFIMDLLTSDLLRAIVSKTTLKGVLHSDAKDRETLLESLERSRKSAKERIKSNLT